MEVGYSQAQAQRVLKQRNMLVLACASLGVIALFALVGAASKDREVVLQPVLTNPLTISSQGVSRQYLELVTRDASVLMFNRTPQNLEYWIESVLKITHPSAYGKLKGELLRIANDQRGSSVAQYFTIEGMNVDPAGLTSEVTGVLHTLVGRQEVSAIKRTFRFDWTYSGVELRLVGFGAVVPPGEASKSGGAAPAPTETTDALP